MLSLHDLIRQQTAQPYREYLLGLADMFEQEAEQFSNRNKGGQHCGRGPILAKVPSAAAECRRIARGIRSFLDQQKLLSVRRLEREVRDD